MLSAENIFLLDNMMSYFFLENFTHNLSVVRILPNFENKTFTFETLLNYLLKRCFFRRISCYFLTLVSQQMVVAGSVVDPDPQGSETFCRIRIRNSRLSGSDSDPKLDLNLTINHPKN
jgi:hypothetical protein